MKKEAITFEGMGRKGVRYTSANTVMELVLRPEIKTASIVKVWGTPGGRNERGTKKDTLAMVQQFKTDFPAIVCILDQVSRTDEMLHLYDAGFRDGTWSVRDDATVEITGSGVELHISRLARFGSICMAWYAPDAHRKLGREILL